MRTACPQKALTLCLAFLTLNRSHSYSGLDPRTGLRRKMPAKLVMKEPSFTGSAASLAAAFMLTVRHANAFILFTPVACGGIYLYDIPLTQSLVPGVVVVAAAAAAAVAHFV